MGCLHSDSAGTALLVIRSMNGRGAEVKARVEGKDRGARMRSQGIGSCKSKELQKF